MTIESDFSIDLKIKHKPFGYDFSSLSKLVTSLPTSYKSITSLNRSSKSSTTSSISSPSPTSSISSSSSSSSSSYSYSLSSGVGSNNTSFKTEPNIEDSFNTAKSRPTPLSELILNREQQQPQPYDSTFSKTISSTSKPSSFNLSLDERYRESTIIDHFPDLSVEQQTNLINKWVPFDDIQKKIPVPDADPKKFIFNYNSSNLSAKKELNYLGIIDVNPEEYTQMYGAELKQSSDLPKYILDIKTPDNLKLAAEITESEIHELEGDVDALKLVDLDREELGIYRQYLQRIGVTS